MAEEVVGCQGSDSECTSSDGTGELPSFLVRSEQSPVVSSGSVVAAVALLDEAVGIGGVVAVRSVL